VVTDHNAHILNILLNHVAKFSSRHTHSNAAQYALQTEAQPIRNANVAIKLRHFAVSLTAVSYLNRQIKIFKYA